ncbi:hypothetical protein HBH70_162130 [Parastagonospora nodorum]|nr:hypothetical protein HBH52_224600 [Parastagonospora nodorum]KAH3964893.1 hypothetical protein HBH51_155590 [Parastagonospora nodorum]KAH3995353.1 hypothetical protein HBI10_173660 [Parastagonospora nodorum]KAH4016089.1 hypothetical protein HBI13_153100 [Parastagonospora nodorum]KAH4161354.1 hypothetical protein HBH43_171350 [Parastagonospora nodorum]
MPSHSTATTPRTSVELAKEAFASSSSSFTTTASSTKKSSGMWSSIKRHVKEHHEGLNGAYATYYGQGQGVQRLGKQEVWEYKRGGRN